MTTVYVRPITDDERYFGISFQKILKLLRAFFKTKDWSSYPKVKEILLKYSNLPYFKKINNLIIDIDKQFAEIDKANNIDMTNLEKIVKQAENALFGGNETSFLNLASQLSNVDYSVRKSEPKLYRYHPWHVENAWIFQRIGLLDDFENEDQEKVLAIDFKQPLWTFLTIPDDRKDDFEFMVWWLLNLKTNNEPVILSNSDFKKYSEFAYASPDFRKLQQLLSDYFHDNSRKLIPEIVSLIESIPDLKKVNDETKKKITTVYRGISMDEDETIKSIKAEEQSRKFVATSLSYRSAKNFALQIGHLESEENRRSEDGIVIEYSVTPESILFSSEILGGVFNEREVVIDTTKSKISEITRV